MHIFTIIDSKCFDLPGTNGAFKHLATVGYGLREFIYFIDTKTYKTYIEELTGGQLKWIDDDSLWESIGYFLQERKLTYIMEKK